MLLCDSSKEEASGINKNRESRGYITYTNDSQSQVYSLWGILGGGGLLEIGAIVMLHYIFTSF